MKIHPSAAVSLQAELASDVEIGPFCVVEARTTIGRGTRLASHVVIKTGTTLGADNEVCDGAVLGGLPQHIQPPDSPGALVIGDTNVIRENATLHRSLYCDQSTRVGDHTLLMVGSHVGHDCAIGDHVVLTNNVMLGGHVEIGSRAYLGGGAAVHQHARIGRLTMIGGYAQVKRDVPCYLLVDGDTGMVVGLNRIGLRRAGYSPDDIQQLRSAYQIIYRQGLTWDEVHVALAEQFSQGPAAELAEFLTGGTRGFVQERRTPPGATIRIHQAEGEQADALQAVAQRAESTIRSQAG